MYLPRCAAYFMVKEPTESTQWQNGAYNLLEWDKGVADGIEYFDIELTRLGSNGLLYGAMNVACKNYSPKSLKVYLEDVPTGDDYFVVLLNSSHGVVHTLSPRFSIVNASDATTTASASATTDTSLATFTISGSPDPTRDFATTFASEASTVLLRIGRGHVLGGVGVVVGLVIGAALTLRL
ncbi:hypothetical protein BDZ89DRAFT_951466 [Hymenopellis radicata]|nr:hypothetical protein BDZ89DRAFT_951466 [Hymenopellis radicata]